MSSPSRSAYPIRSRGLQRVLVREQQVVHLPEGALPGGGLGRLGRELGSRVDIVEREVPPHVAQVAEIGQQRPDDRLGLAAVRALEVAVLDQGDRRLIRPAHVVPVRVDRDGQVDDGLGRADERPEPQPRAAARAVARKTTQVSSDAQSAARRMPSLASSSCSPSKASVAMSSDTVKPMPAIAPAPVTAAQPTGGRTRPRVRRVTSQAKPAIPTGLPTT